MTLTVLAPQVIYERVAAMVGAENVSMVDGVCSVAPKDAEQASEVMRFADANGLAVCAKGAGSKLGWFNEAQIDLQLSTRRINAVREHTWQDMTCTVEAGCSWQAMQDALAVHGQQVALDPLWPAQATVGGVIGANDSGALRLRYGGLRDLVIGMTLVLADGTVARSGGKVVKNVAGYDLPKLLCGSFGTLALITEVTFRLHAIARHTVSLTARADAPEPLGKLLLRLLDSHFSIQSMQMRSDRAGFALDVRLAALPEVLATQQDGLMGVAYSMGVVAHLSEENVWSAREDMFDDAAVVFKATMLPSVIASTLQAIRELGGSAVAQAVGIVTGSLPAGTSVQNLVNLRAQLEAADGSLTVLRGDMEPGFDRWGTPPSSLPLMRAVKQQFDPNGILNPGRFLGKI